MTIETLVTAGSALVGALSLSAFVYDLHSRKPASSRDRTITITIEDSSGERARVVARSSRRVDEVKQDFERLVAQPS